MAGKVIVLCYHRINELDIDKNCLAVSEENFRSHLKWLKDNYVLLSADEDWNITSKDGVVVTFDDGYEDFYSKALPILKELDVPATVFITNGEDADSRMMWWDELEYLIYDGYTPPFLRLEDDLFAYNWRLDSIQKKDDCYEQIHFLMKNLISCEKRNDWLNQMWKWKGKERTLIDRYKMLSDEKIIELSKCSLITLGAHTLFHGSLKNRDEKEQKIEIEESIDKLEHVIQRKTSVFSYPFGVHEKDYDDIANEICKSKGINKTFSTNFGAWNNSMSLFNIKRNGVNNKDLEEFKEYLKCIEEA